MKKQLIRKGVFETNSSSCHSLSIAEGDSIVLDTIHPNKNGVVEIEGAEFGWEQDVYHDPMSKAGYVMIYAMDWARDNSEKYQQVLKDVIKKQTGAEEVVFSNSGDKYYPYGYIDHQSVEDGELDYLFENEELLRNFIFHPHSSLETDNDNH